MADENNIIKPVSFYQNLPESFEIKYRNLGSDIYQDEEDDLDDLEELASNFILPEVLAKSRTNKVNLNLNNVNDGSPWEQKLANAYRKAGVTNHNMILSLVAQDALETGWGKKTVGDFNYGNIQKGTWTGPVKSGGDKHADGTRYIAQFRSYESIDHYVKDKLDLLKRVYNFNQNDNFDQFISKLQGENSGKRKYAESTNYKNAVRSVYDSVLKRLRI